MITPSFNQNLLSVMLIFAIITLALFIIALTLLIQWFRKSGYLLIELYKYQYLKQPNPNYLNMAVRETIQMRVYRLAEKKRVSLSSEAMELIIIPIEENFRNDINWLNRNDTWKTSLVIIFDTLQEIVNERYDSERSREIKSVDVLLAFQIRWCNIPPICKPIYE